MNPGYDHWLSSGSGVSGVPFSFIVTKSYAGVEISINKGTQEENKKMFDLLINREEAIEASYGSHLIWERLDVKNTLTIFLFFNMIILAIMLISYYVKR